MFTIFSIPKPFTDPHINIIQTNAINSWLNVSDTIEIILCGNDFGVKEICQKNNIQHISNVECTNSSTPLLSSVFNLVREKAKYDIIIYINADIIITSDFLKIFNLLPKQDFLIVGRRYDLNITKLLDFSKNWEE
ncbi:glycosyl transferase family 2, partial [Patescibacteria group bacterium]|nr:glycosyl transferase family 2 [Patescibacteria group bacterium]